MGQALYRTYRSKSLGELVGQEHITQTLGNALAQGAISHAYLFTGPRGVGKTSVARILAHEINKLPYDGTHHLDIIEIDAASNRRIDDIRDLRDKVHIAPAHAPYKVYIIDEVHMLTGESFNALLKTLEEPPKHAVFILATTEVHKLPATIISRTQRFTFRPAPLEVMIKHLKDIAKKENITIDDNALQLIAEHGEGSFRDSIGLLDQLATIAGGNVTSKDVEQLLGLAPQQTIDAITHALLESDTPTIVKLLGDLEKQGAMATHLLPQLLRSLQARSLQHSHFYPLIGQLLEIPRSYNPNLKLLTTLVSFTLPKQKETVQSVPAVASPPKPIVTISKPIEAMASASPKDQTTKKSDKPTKRPPKAQEPQTATSNLQTFDLYNWSKVVYAVKAVSHPLFSVLRLVKPEFDSTTQTLTLKCKFALHSRKLDDAKLRAQLVEVMTATLGGAPIIKTAIDPETQAPELSDPGVEPPQQNATTDSIIAVMGGGEVVHA